MSVRVNRLLFMAAEYLAAGDFDGALSAYKDAGVKSELISFAERCATAGQFYPMRDAYLAAQGSVPVALSLACARAALKLGRMDAAEQAFNAANDADGYAELGSAFLKAFNKERAIRYFALAKKLVPKEEMLAAAHAIRRQGFRRFGEAMEWYLLAGATDELLKFGEIMLTHGHLHLGELAFSLAQVPIPKQLLITCAREIRLEHGWAGSPRSEAIRAYQLAGAMKILTKLGDDEMKLCHWGSAHEYYRAVKPLPVDKIMLVGNQALMHAQAREAYHVFLRIPEHVTAEQWVRCGDGMARDERHRSPEMVLDAYIRGKAAEQLVAFGDSLIQMERSNPRSLAWDIRIVVAAYEASGLPISPERWLQCGKLMLASENDPAVVDAVRVFERCGAHEELLQCAKYFMPHHGPARHNPEMVKRALEAAARCKFPDPPPSEPAHVAAA